MEELGKLERCTSGPERWRLARTSSTVSTGNCVRTMTVKLPRRAVQEMVNVCLVPSPWNAETGSQATAVSVAVSPAIGNH